ncbi:MAG: VCBS repeat-containing protein, partial [Bacteroidota bacterium]
NQLYLNQGDLRFKEVSKQSGARGSKGFSTGVVMVDINQDGLLDMYICKSGRFDQEDVRRNELLINQGLNADGIPQFKEEAKSYGLDIPAYSTQASFFDYDKDGDLDMFLINHGIDTYANEDIPKLKNQQDGLSGVMLFQNQEGKYTDVSAEAGLENNMLGFGLGLAVGDLNGDQWPDVYVSMDYSGKDHLYINQQNGTFKESIEQLTGHTSFYAMGNDMADINNDGRLDILNLDMVAADNYGVKTSMSAMNPEQFDQLIREGQHRQYMYNSLLLNNGNSDENSLLPFSDIAQMGGIASTDWSWAPLMFDFDNDGWRDIFITNGIKRNIRNNDAVKKVNQLRALMPQLTDRNQKAQLIQQMLNTFPYHRTPNAFFRNTQSFAFEDIREWVGVDSMPTASNGAAYADLDRDGDLELVINNVDQAAFLYKNNTVEKGGGNFLRIRAKGPRQNMTGIGLRVEVKFKEQKKVAELYPSRGYMSSVEPIIHLGMGKSKTIDEIKAIWPDGKEQLLQNVKVNQLLELSYADASAPSLPVVAPQKLFQHITKAYDRETLHKENDFDDFKRESLLPHKMSHAGPAVAVGDLNGDGLDDYFIGGARGLAAQLWVQRENGTFILSEKSLWEKEKKYEDSEALILDLEGDGDMDLMVASGGNEVEAGDQTYALRIYENKGNGKLKALTQTGFDIKESVGALEAGDVDGDGDLDVFVGGRQIPGQYPLPANSYLLINKSSSAIMLVDETESWAPFFKQMGMITDAAWKDINGDKKEDLLLLGEWMAPKLFLAEEGMLSDVSKGSKLENAVGWWNNCEWADLDGDGDMDFVAGNLGLNYKYKASDQEPFQIYAHDFDQNNSLDIVLGYQVGDKSFPLRGRECSSNQMPFIKEQFPNYDAFGKATLTDVYGSRGLEKAVQYAATTFASSWFEQQEDGSFEQHLLPAAAQLSATNDIFIADLNGDDHLDLVLGGNLLQSEVETPRNDASIGVVLAGNGKGGFKALDAEESGLFISGEVRHMFPIRIRGKSALLIGKNQDIVQILSYKSSTSPTIDKQG